jgi:YebC/PmpR family DNA-binding regulatory protein
MSGHSKWSRVKHIKGAVDARRGKVFSKLSREIIAAAKAGGGDPRLNARLRTAIDAAKAQNMPNDTIERAIKKGTGELGGDVISEITYEGYAPGGVAILVECVTDNKNRSSAEIRSTFTRNHGTLGTPGSVSHLFARKGEIRVPATSVDEDRMIEAALDAGAEDVALEGDEHVLVTAPDRLFAVGDALRSRSVTPASQKLVQFPLTTIPVVEPSTAQQVLRLYEALDDLDDVQNVYANFEIPDELIEELTV